MYSNVHHVPNNCSSAAVLRRFADEEDGAAYTLSFVMVMPIEQIERAGRLLDALAATGHGNDTVEPITAYEVDE